MLDKTGWLNSTNKTTLVALFTVRHNTSGHDGWWWLTDTASMSDTEGLELRRLLSRRVETLPRVRDKEMRSGDVTGGNMESLMDEIEMRCVFENICVEEDDVCFVLEILSLEL